MSDDLSKTAQELEKSADYRVLRRLVPRDVFMPVPNGEQTKVGVVLDVETTGLDPKKCEVIEMGMVKFAYLADGRMTHVIDNFGALNEPTNPIPPEITDLTGITNEMVAGQHINASAVSAFVADANIVIAHNASFDDSLRNATGRNSSTCRGDAPLTRLTGATTDLQAQGWRIF